MKSFSATAIPATSAAEALRLAFDLFEFGEQMMRRSLRADHPGESDGEIERLISEWLLARPGAELGDAAGRQCRRRALEI